MTLIELTHNVDASRGGVHHDPATVSLTALEERYAVIERIHQAMPIAEAVELMRNDPRCGCDGGRCDWDDLFTLEHALATRMAAAA